jgi:V/A-type H+-transporting ATPase subunit A
MMKVVGEEGTSLDDYTIYLKGEFLDAVYLQQNSFDTVDCSVSVERQRATFGIVTRILGSKLKLKDKDEARSWFNTLRQKFLDLNGAEWNSPRFKELGTVIATMINERAESIAAAASRHIEALE